ncbi:hypothetical protein PROVRETT_10079 [Providencia rettgeri DSM 1131]|nr:hypothetical protein PROVRETT_10079 [Providencia rettgeri DSM 1131]
MRENGVCSVFRDRRIRMIHCHCLYMLGYSCFLFLNVVWEKVA